MGPEAKQEPNAVTSTNSAAPAAIPDWVHDIVRLDRPLAVIDLETTGTAPYRDRIIEIAAVKIHPDGRKETRRRRLNPGVSIPPASTAIHGIRDEDVAQEPEFRQIASSLAEYLEGCDLAGFGITMFDLPLLRAEFERSGIQFHLAGRRIIDAKNIYHLKEPRNLTAAHEFYCGAAFADAHSAEADALAAYRVLLGQLQRYSDLPRSMDALHRLSNPMEAHYVDREGKLVWQEGEVFFHFGKHRGEPLREVCVTDPEYVRWFASGDAPAELKSILAEALEGRFPERRHAPAGRALSKHFGPGRSAAPSLFDGSRVGPTEGPSLAAPLADARTREDSAERLPPPRRGWRRVLESAAFW